MKKAKHIILAAVSLIVILLPMLILPLAAVIIPSQYSNTFLGALPQKVERLESIEEPKVVVIGGSSVAFGIDSARMEEHLGMPVVNFGLYAAIGTRAMIELSKKSIGEGDVIILAPELDPQTLSLYFSSENMLNAIDSDYSIAASLDVDSKLSLIGGLWKHVQAKYAYSRGTAPDPEGVYNSKNFNEYGDVVWSRPENVMQFHYDPNTLIDLSPEIIDPDFIDFVNEYIDYCERRGATVYFSYAPMNRLAVEKGSTDGSAYEFSDYLEENINCEFISLIDYYVIDERYFYDTNYHLNDVGVLLRTKLLLEDLSIALGIDPTVAFSVPEAPDLPLADVVFEGEDENTKYFTFERMASGAYMISGLSELGRTATELVVPICYEGYKVTAIGEDALSGGAVTKLIITEDTHLRNFINGFYGDSHLTDIWIYYDYSDPVDKIVPAADFRGASVHVTPTSAFLNDYDWGNTATNFRFVTDIPE